MTVRVSKPEFNLREKITELDYDRVPFQKMPVGGIVQVISVHKGDYFTTTIANQPLIMVRHSDDTIKILENRCAHRGVELVAQTHGNTGRTFSCPYHAWTYKTDGSLIGIPVKEGYDKTGFEKSSAKKGLQKIKNIRVYRDFVFVRLADEGLSFEEFFLP